MREYLSPSRTSRCFRSDRVCYLRSGPNHFEDAGAARSWANEHIAMAPGPARSTARFGVSNPSVGVAARRQSDVIMN